MTIYLYIMCRYMGSTEDFRYIVLFIPSYVAAKICNDNFSLKSKLGFFILACSSEKHPSVTTSVCTIALFRLNITQR